MMDCSTGSRSWRLVEGAEQIVRARCAFKPYDEHPNDWQRYPGYMVPPPSVPLRRGILCPLRHSAGSAHGPGAYLVVRLARH
jgi:hypothetical protein